MAGYYLYSLDSEVFSQLTTQPSDDQARFAAQALLLELDEFEADELDAAKLTKDPDMLAPLVKKRLASADWYGDLTYHEAVAWDGMLRQFSNELGKQLNLGLLIPVRNTATAKRVLWVQTDT